MRKNCHRYNMSFELLIRQLHLWRKSHYSKEDIASGLPYTITGVGGTSIGIKAVKSPTYDVESGAVQILVKNSSIREEDYSIHYSGDGREQVYTLTQWQEYLKQHNSWLKKT